MAAVVVAMDQGRGQPTLVIWRDGEIAAFTWLQQVRPVSRVLSRWQDPRQRPWLRIEDAAGHTFLIGNRGGQWWALPWPPLQVPGDALGERPDSVRQHPQTMVAGSSYSWGEPIRPEDYGAKQSRTGRKLPPVGSQRKVSRC